MRPLAAAALLLLLCGAPRAAGPGAHYFTVVLNGAYNFAGGSAGMGESYTVLQSMVKQADERGVKLTLLFSAQYAEFIATSTARSAELAGWRRAGHEIGAYHQGPETAAWDAYTDLKGEALKAVKKGKGGPAGGHGEFLAAVKRLEPDPKTGCMVGSADGKFLAAAPPYEVCLRADPGGGRGAAAGINAALVVPLAGGPRRYLSVFRPADKAGIEAAERAYGGLETGVYGAAFRSTPAEFGAFYAWLKFLSGRDPQGLRSRAVSSLVAGGLLEERTAKPPEGKKPEKKEPPRPEAPGPLVSATQAWTQDPPAQPREIPRLKPVQSFFGQPGYRVPSPRGRPPAKRGYCGDGICDMLERAVPGSCRQDCGK